MTRKDVYQMAIQCVPPAWVAPLGLSQLERFASLVAAAEREACAKVCEQMETYGDPVQCWLDQCAAAIRARGEP